MATLEQLDEQLALIAADAREQLARIDATKHRMVRVLHDVERAGGAGRGPRVESVRHALRALLDARRAVEHVVKQAADARARLPRGAAAGGGWLPAYVQAMTAAGSTDVGEALRQVSAAELVLHVAEEVATSAVRDLVNITGAWKVVPVGAQIAEDARKPPPQPAAATPKVVHNMSKFLRAKVASSNGRIPRAAWTYANNRLVELTDPAAVPIRVSFAFTRWAVVGALALTPVGWATVTATEIALKAGAWALVKGTTRVVERQ
jgi:hypothetical protein